MQGAATLPNVAKVFGMVGAEVVNARDAETRSAEGVVTYVEPPEYFEAEGSSAFG